MKTTYKELSIKKKYPLKKKIEHTKKRLKEFYEFTNGNCFISFSGGIDSTVLLHIARSIYPDIKAVFSNTTNEDPDLIKFVKTIENVTTVHPKMNFKQVVKKFGFPLVSKRVSRSIKELRKPTQDNPNIRNLYITGLNRKGQFSQSWQLAKKWYFLMDKENIKFDITSICCDILKKEPMKRYVKETKTYPITGTNTEESSDRELNYIKYGCNITDSKNPVSRPLSIWTNKDIWKYIKANDVAYCSLYDDTILKDGTIIKAEKRTGCVACGMGCHLESESRFEKLKLRHPKYHRNIMNHTNNGVTYKEALETVLNIKDEFKTKEYQSKIKDLAIKDLDDCHVVCRDGKKENA